MEYRKKFGQTMGHNTAHGSFENSPSPGIVTSSPRYPKSNGLAEVTVKSVKNLIKKCKNLKEDILKGLMIPRNTPLACGKSPAELVYNRRLRDNLPTINDIQSPNVKIQGDRNLKLERQITKRNHDKTSPAHKPITFRPGQLIAIQNNVTHEWNSRGRIIKYIHPRSYEVKLENGQTDNFTQFLPFTRTGVNLK